MLLVII